MGAKVENESQIMDVSDTSFWVAYYRAKESERSDALFKDPYAKVLVGDRGKKISDSMASISRYTEWSVISRTVIIDRFIEKLIKEGVDAVINLGAGLDTRPYRMNLPEDLEWVEVDYQNIIAHKNKLLAAEKPKCRLSRNVVDLSNSKDRVEFFKNVVPNAKKVLIITEGVIPYLSFEQVTELSKDLLAQTRFQFWITEYFHKKVYRYLKNTVRDLKMKNAPFRFYPDDWIGFFRNLGWTEMEFGFSGDIGVEFNRKPPMPKIAQLLYAFLPKRIKEEGRKMAGYVIFKK
jgi:methyltransferase (TIGR00027 family)